MKQHILREDCVPVAGEQAPISAAPAKIPNSAVQTETAGRGTRDLDEVMQQRMKRLQHFTDNQRPAAEREADEVAASVKGVSTPAEIKHALGESMGADFSGVRFHTGASAAQKADDIGARAYTTGRDVYFDGEGFDPAVAAHELVHTAQQGAVQSSMSVESAPAGGVQMLPGFLKRIKEDWKYGKAQKAQSSGLKLANQQMGQQLGGIGPQVDQEGLNGQFAIMSSTNRDTFGEARKTRLSLQTRSDSQTPRIATYNRLEGEVQNRNAQRRNQGETFISKLASGRMFSSSRTRKDQRSQSFLNQHSLSQAERNQLDSINASKGALQSAVTTRGERTAEAQTLGTERGLGNLSSISGGRQMQGLYEMGGQNETEEQKGARKTRNTDNFTAIGNAFGGNVTAGNLTSIVSMATPIVAGVMEGGALNPALADDLAWVQQNYSRLSGISSQAMLISDVVDAAKGKLNTDQEKSAFEQRIFGEGGRAAYGQRFVALQMLVRSMAKKLEEHSGFSSKGN